MENTVGMAMRQRTLLGETKFGASDAQAQCKAPWQPSVWSSLVRRSRGPAKCRLKAECSSSHLMKPPGPARNPPKAADAEAKGTDSTTATCSQANYILNEIASRSREQHGSGSTERSSWSKKEWRSWCKEDSMVHHDRQR